MNLNMEQMHDYGNEMLSAVVAILEEEHVPYIAIYGTLLGAIRHRGPIPWDYDIDLAIPEPELEHFLEVMGKRLPEQYWVDFRSNGVLVKSMPRIGLTGYSTNTLHIDIYRLVGYPAEKKKQERFAKNSRLMVSLRCAKVYRYSGKKKYTANLVKALTCFIPPEKFAQRFDRFCKKYPFDEADVIGINTEVPAEKNVFTKDILNTITVPYDNLQIRVPADYHEVLTQLYGNYEQYPPEAEREKALLAVYRVEQLQQQN